MLVIATSVIRHIIVKLKYYCVICEDHIFSKGANNFMLYYRSAQKQNDNCFVAMFQILQNPDLDLSKV
jgi:hypothetical protein